MARPLKIGLALGGGAARAFSHVGVLAGLERHGIAVDLVTGTSMGAILGAMYVTHRDVAALKVRLADYLHSEEFARSGFDFFRELDAQGEGLLFRMRRMVRRGVFNTLMVTRAALVSDEIAARNYAYLIDDLTVAQGRLPFAAIALDLRSGARTILDRGRLRDIVAASCAMPGVLNPVTLDGRLLVDGGWVEAVPVLAARELGADFVIAVEVGNPPENFPAPRNALDVIGRADALVRGTLANTQLKSADFILAPHNDVPHWADFSTAEQAIARGEEELERHLPALRRAIAGAGRRAWWRRG
jgi:NTE family protein